jgi:hypothetical protein
MCVGITGKGRLLMQRWTIANPSYPFLGGLASEYLPIGIFEMDSLKQVGEITPQGHRFDQIQIGSRSLITATAVNQVVVFDLDDGRKLLSAPLSVRDKAFLNSEGGLLLVRGPAGAKVYDLNQGRRLWTQDGDFETAEFAGPSTIRIADFSDGASRYRHWNAFTGDLVDTIRLPGDGGKELTWSSTGVGVKDHPPELNAGSYGRSVILLQTERPVWRLYGAASYKPALDDFHFTKDGAELRLGYFQGRRFRVRRWNAVDGSPLGAYTDPSNIPIAQWSDDDRYVLVLSEQSAPEIFLQPLRLLERSGLVGTRLYWIELRVDLFDATTGEFLGLVRSGGQMAATLSDAGILAWNADGTCDYFALPVRRAWWLLWAWMIGPPIALWTLMRVWRARRTVDSAQPAAKPERRALTANGREAAS